MSIVLESTSAVDLEIQQVVNKWPLAELEDINSKACSECQEALMQLSPEAVSAFKEYGYAYIVSNYHD